MSKVCADQARGAAETYRPKGTHPLETSLGKTYPIQSPKTNIRCDAVTPGAIPPAGRRLGDLARNGYRPTSTAVDSNRETAVPPRSESAPCSTTSTSSSACSWSSRGRCKMRGRTPAGAALFCVDYVSIKAGAWICNRIAKLASVPPELV